MTSAPGNPLHQRFSWLQSRVSNVPKFGLLLLLFCWAILLAEVPSHYRLWVFWSPNTTVFGLEYNFGQLIANLYFFGHYRVFDQGLGVYFHAHRMPFIPLFFWCTSHLISPDLLTNFLFKNLCFGTLWALAIARIARAHNANVLLTIAAAALGLLIPFNVQVITNLSHEEAFLFYFLAMLAACLLVRRSTADFWIVGLLLAACYLTKSSLLLLCLLAAGIELYRGVADRKVFHALLPSLLLLLAICGWGVFTLHETGRFAFGEHSSSYNGWNLWKGNNPWIKTLYPGENLDDLDQAGVFRPRQAVQNEWEWNDYCEQRAKDFISTHRDETFHNFLKKLKVSLFSLRHVFPGDLSMPRPLWYSMLINRAIFWLALGLAVLDCIRRAKDRKATQGTCLRLLCVIAVVVCYLAPYLAGFVYFRHLIPLFGMGLVFLFYRLTLPASKVDSAAA